MAQTALNSKTRKTAAGNAASGNTGVEFSLEAEDSSGPVERFGNLQPQEVILGLLGEYVDKGERVWSGGLVSLLGDLHFSGPASRIALNRVVARNLLEPSREGRFISYAITPHLAAVHEEGRRQLFSRATDAAWQGEWTLVRYSIPEDLRAERGRLSRWLNFRGFGSLQDGIWIAAGDRQDDVLPLIKQLSLDEHVMTFVGKIASDNAVQHVAGQAWNLNALVKMYELFMGTFSKYSTRGALAKWGPREYFVLRTRLIEMFRQTAVHDPHLPDKILKVKWKRRESIELFYKLQAELYEGAREYFREKAIRDFGVSELPKEARGPAKAQKAKNGAAKR
jgi:phenylacetic acid degradation operon negative regulatory protein